MAAYENFSENDVKFLTFVKNGLGNITNLNSPLFQRVKELSKKETFGPKGVEKRHYNRHSINLKMGASSMDYPGRTSFGVGLYRQIPTVIALTYAIDQQTMDAYKYPSAGQVNNNKGSLVKMQEELQMLAEGLGQRLDFQVATSDTSGKLAIASSGTQSTTTLTTQTVWTSGDPAAGVGLSQLYTEVDYDVINPSTGAVRTQFRINAADEYRLNRSTHVIDFTGSALSAAAVAGDYIVPRDSGFQSIYGFPKLFSGSKTGFWQGKIVTGSTLDQTPTTDAGNNSLNNYLMQKTIGKRQIRNMTQEISPFRWITSMAQELEYISTGWGMFEINNGQGGTLDSTIKKARYHQDLESFPHIDADKMFGIDFSDVTLGEQFGPGVISPDGLIWRQMAAASGSNLMGRGVWYTVYGYILNFMIENPQKHMSIIKLYVNPNAPTLTNYTATT